MASSMRRAYWSRLATIRSPRWAGVLRGEDGCGDYGEAPGVLVCLRNGKLGGSNSTAGSDLESRVYERRRWIAGPWFPGSPTAPDYGADGTRLRAHGMKSRCACAFRRADR